MRRYEQVKHKAYYSDVMSFRKEMIEMKKQEMSCVDCAVQNCNKMDGTYPEFCLTTHMDESVLQDAMNCYEEEENHKVMWNRIIIASTQEWKRLWHLPRKSEQRKLESQHVWGFCEKVVHWLLFCGLMDLKYLEWLVRQERRRRYL